MKLKFGVDVILEITGQNQFCATLNSIDEKMLKLIIGKRTSQMLLKLAL